MTEITVAALQLAFSTDAHANIARVADMVREAAGKGAQVVLPPELFEGEYFCRVEAEGLFAAAKPTSAQPSVIAMQRRADDIGIWLPTRADGRGVGQEYVRTGRSGGTPPN